MKRFLSLALLLSAFTVRAVAQDAFPVDADTKKITYTEVVTVNGARKAELNKRAQSWASAAHYAPANRQQPDAYTCQGKMNVNYPSITAGKTDKGIVSFVATVYCKDGKYKYVVTDFAHQGLDGRGDGGKLENETPECGKYIMTVASWNKIKEETRAEMANVLASLKAEMEKKPAPPKKKPTDF